MIVGRGGILSPEAAEHAGGKLGTAIEILTVEEAIDMREMYRSSTLVALRSPNPRLFQEAAALKQTRESAYEIGFAADRLHRTDLAVESYEAAIELMRQVGLEI